MYVAIRNKIETTGDRLSPWQWWLLAVVFLGVSLLAQGWLNSWYERSQFPVPYFVGQTTFNAMELKSYYAILLSKSTLGVFVITQCVDFVYMATVFVAFFCLTMAIYVVVPPIRAFRVLAVVMVLIAPFAAIFDALENFVSFITLVKPLTFADWLVYPYSALAALKFGVYALTYLWAPVGIGVALFGVSRESLQGILSRQKI